MDWKFEFRYGVSVKDFNPILVPQAVTDPIGLHLVFICMPIQDLFDILYTEIFGQLEYIETIECQEVYE